MKDENGSKTASTRRTVMRLMAVLCALNLVLCAVIGAAREIGGRISSPAIAALNAYKCQPQPCWNSIAVDETTVVQAEATLKADARFPIVFKGPNTLQWTGASIPGWRDGMMMVNVQDRQSRIGAIMVSPAWRALDLGDAFAVFGRPIAVCEERGAGRQVLFDHNLIVRVTPSLPDIEVHLGPEMAVGTIYAGTNLVTYLTRMRTIDEQVHHVPWRGLAKVGTYQPCN